MTIKNRNRINLFLIFISLMLILGIGIITPFQFFQGKLIFPSNIPQPKFQNIFFINFNFIAVLGSIYIFPLFAFITLLYINVEFEKTQSTEIIYFSIFLIACLTECSRLLFPFLNLWNTDFNVAAVSSSITLFGRILAPLSLLFAVLYNKTESRQYTEQNIIILFVISIYISLILPLNTKNALPLCHYEWGYAKLFLYAQYTIFAVTIVTQIVNSLQDNSQHKIPAGLIILICGYLLLCNTYNFLFLTAGAVLIQTGTLIYLKDLHKIYLWNDR